MLKKRPDFDNLSKRDQKQLIEVYENIMVWLAKAGSENRKVNKIRPRESPRNRILILYDGGGLLMTFLLYPKSLSTI